MSQSQASTMGAFEMEDHPLASIFPMMGDEELAELSESIRSNGQLQPIVLHEGKILDGRNRHRACLMAGVTPTFVDYPGTDALEFVVANNLNRRHLSPSQLAWVASNIETMRHGGDRKSNQNANLRLDVTRSHAAEMFKVSKRSVASAAIVRDFGAPDLQQALAKGDIAVSTAAELALLPKHEQSEVIAWDEKRILRKAAEIRAAKREALRIANQAKARITAPRVDGEYDVIVVDPPWPMKRIERDVAPNQVAELEYPTMELEQIRDIDIPAADDCHLWLWTTHKFLPDALRILENWGFHYVNLFTWFKTGGFQPFGLPQYNTEFAVYGRKGAPKFVDTKNFFVGFKGARGAHSEKPTEFYETIKRVTDGRRLDMFARRSITGFDAWGNEAPSQA